MKTVWNDIYFKTYSYDFAGQLQITGTCPRTYDNNQNKIYTTGYPKTYPGGQHCNWNIEVNQGKSIELEFEAFNLESHDDCKYDWLQIYDGGNSSSHDLTGKLCGYIIPGNIRSSGNRLFLAWRTDSSSHFSGFKIAGKLAGK